MNPKPGPTRAVTVKAPFEGQPSSDISASVFVFDAHGTLVAAAPLKGGETSVSIPEELAGSERVFVGPTPRPGQKPFTIDDLQRLHAYQPAVTIDAKSATVDLKAIPQTLWKYWLWYLCRIRGKVVKSVNGVDFPVCNAQVRICEMEPFWLILQRLPDDQVLKLRDDVLRAFATPPAAAKPAARPPAAPAVQPETIQLSALHAVPAATITSLQASSAVVLRQSLAANLALYRPFFCVWPWWWLLFERCVEIGTVMTDAQGAFDLDHWQLVGEETSVYVSVQYSIGGVWTNVYAPPLACNVYWNYACGSDITIRVTDPRVPACGSDPNLPGKDVVLMTIGNDLSPVQIGSTGLTNAGGPLGGSVEPHVAFSRNALIGSGITHYRWSYRRLTLSDGTTNANVSGYTPITTPVYRHYAVLIPGSPPSLSFPTELMGPDPAYPGKDLFKIQPTVQPGDGWIVLDARADTATAFFLTDVLAANPDDAAGQYELKLELFRNGNAVNFSDEGIGTHLAAIAAPFGSQTVTTNPADPSHLFTAGGKTVAMRWVLWVDNNVCHGNVADVQVTGGALGPCGFYNLPAGNPQNTAVTVSFMASHPHNFASYDFDLARGSSGVITALSADGPVGGSGANGYNRVGTGTTFARTYVAHDLFNIVDGGPAPNCDRGAFAEYLYVTAWATDGWDRLSYLDGPRGAPGEIGLKAFALTP